MSDLKLIRCLSCGATNRVPLEKIGRGLQPVCGRCKTALPFENKPVKVTDANFAAEVERSPLPVLLDMWAPWCGPCGMVAPVIEELAPDAPGTYGLVIALSNGSMMRIVASHVRLPGGYHLLMGRESARFESLVERFW